MLNATPLKLKTAEKPQKPAKVQNTLQKADDEKAHERKLDRAYNDMM